MGSGTANTVHDNGPSRCHQPPGGCCTLARKNVCVSIRIGRPVEHDLRSLLDAAAEDSVTYGQAGITNESEPPPGYHLDRCMRRLGRASSDFVAASDVVRNWQVQRGAGLVVCADGPPGAERGPRPTIDLGPFGWGLGAPGSTSATSVVGVVALAERWNYGLLGCEVQLSCRTLAVSTCCWKAAILPSRMAHT